VYADRPPYTTTKEIIIKSVRQDGSVHEIATWNSTRFIKAITELSEGRESGLKCYNINGTIISGREYVEHVLSQTKIGKGNVCASLAQKDPLLWTWKPFIHYENENAKIVLKIVNSERK